VNNAARLLIGPLLVAATGAQAADPAVVDPPSGDVLLLDSRGRPVPTPIENLHPGLRPGTQTDLNYQTPPTHKGSKAPEAVREKLDSMRAGQPEFEWFPAVPPALMPYLYSQDEFGNTVARPGPLFDVFPLESEVQGAKTWASRRGLRYTLDQAFTYSNMSDVKQGDNQLGNYNLDLQAKWALFDLRGERGTAGWISTQIEYQAALGDATSGQSVEANVGALTNPLTFHSSHSGWRVPELAWQQSFDAGRVVALAGVVNQGNYLDGNSYANTGRGQFMNSALVNSMVLPLPSYNYGLNLQWQPTHDWYGMVGYSVGNANSGEAPGTNFSWQAWSLEWEVGYAPDDVLGLGSGIYRIQPFVARTEGPVQGGLSFNFQQQLGRHSPLAWFGRLGVGGSQVSGGAKAQVGSGLVMSAPLKHLGWVPRLTNDLVGAGFVWSQPSATTRTVYHDNEYVFETFYTLQLSPASIVQPDLQVIWNPAFNPDPGPAVVFQLQFVLKW
jgi:porin